MSEPERDLRREWEQMLAEDRLIEERRIKLCEACRQLGRDAARRKEEAVLAALLGDSK